jgi:MoxR-like ATPase
MVEKVVKEGVELRLSEPADINMYWVGDDTLIRQLKAAWMKVDEEDLPLNPRILGKPGIGKTTLAYAAGKSLKKPVYLFQASMDVRPEDLIITPVIASKNEIEYHASSLVSAMIKGGVCILDEGNRMSEKCWATLAPLMDRRRYVESIIAGIRIYAHEDFRLCVTMNEDSSTYEIPEYISSRLQPKIFIEFPGRVDELEILKYNLPFVDEQILEYTVDFLQNAHIHDEPYTVRDGINILRFYAKLKAEKKEDYNQLSIPDFKDSIIHILDRSAIKYTREEYEKYIKQRKSDLFITLPKKKGSEPLPPSIRVIFDRKNSDDEDSYKEDLSENDEEGNNN